MTAYGEGTKKVIIDEVDKITEDGKHVKFQIRGTDKYFTKWHAADACARKLLLQKHCTKEEFDKIQTINKRVRRAKIAMNVFKCLTETKKFIVRWERVISVENKKALCIQLEEKLKVKLKAGGFSSVGQAKGYILKNSRRI